MSVVLKMRCPNCGNKFRVTFDSAEAESPDCPVCAASAEIPDRLDIALPKAPSVGGSPLARAGEIAFKEMQERGFTDMKDKTDYGETAAPKLTADQQQMAGGFWGGKTQGPTNSPAVASLLAGARQGIEADRARGYRQPIESLHHALKARSRKGQ